MVLFRCVVMLALLAVIWPGRAASQLSSAQLAEMIFKDRYGQRSADGVGFVGDVNLGYLEPYDAPFDSQTGLSHHAGIDYRARTPEPVYSPLSGRILYACQGTGPDNLGALALYVDDASVVSMRSGVRLQGYTLIFLHLSQCTVQAGQHVEAGTRLGLSGDVGVPGRPHLHVEVQRGNDMYPCGRGGDVDSWCPFNSANPTPLTTIQSSTYDPRAYVRKLLFARDLEGKLSASKISETGKVRLSGLNFGRPGRVKAQIDMGSDQEFIACTGGNLLQWEITPQPAEWTGTEIEVAIFPYTVVLCGKEYSFTSEDLPRPLTISVVPSEGGESSSMTFPFKDVPASQWYDEYVVELWAAGRVDGFKAEFDGALKSDNRFAPEADVKNGEALKIIFGALNVAPAAACNCSGTSSDHWARPLICKGLSEGWLSCPLNADDDAQRGFIARVLAAALGMPETQRANGDLFLDVPETHALAREITFCEEQGIFGGYEDGYFRPNRGINRAELSKVVREAQKARGNGGAQ